MSLSKYICIIILFNIKFYLSLVGSQLNNFKLLISFYNGVLFNIILNNG